MWTDLPLLLLRGLERCLRLVVRELYFVFARFLIVHVARIAALVRFDLTDGDEATALWYVEDFTICAHAFGIKGILAVELDLIHWQRGRSKRLVDLQGSLAFVQRSATERT